MMECGQRLLQVGYEFDRFQGMFLFFTPFTSQIFLGDIIFGGANEKYNKAFES
jgi:hypothetical protein